jgi:hypothetical protein
MEAQPPTLSSRANSGFPTTLLSSTATYAAFFKESRMKFTDATKPDRKSGGSRGTCCAPWRQTKALRVSSQVLTKRLPCNVVADGWVEPPQKTNLDKTVSTLFRPATQGKRSGRKQEVSSVHRHPAAGPRELDRNDRKARFLERSLDISVTSRLSRIIHSRWKPCG